MRFNNNRTLISRRSFLGTGLTSACTLYCLPSKLFATMEQNSPGEVILRFAVMSDVHFNGNPEAPEVQRFRRAMEFMYEYSGQQAYPNFDALVVAGDMSNNGVEEQIGLFKKTMDAGLKEGTEAILCMGNHEFYGGNKSLWEKTFGLETNHRYEVKGFQFVTLSPETGSKSNGDYLYALDWFQQEVAAACAADPKKPVFVIQHYHVTPTVYGSRGEDNWGAIDLFDTLQKYPRVIDFSGHSHYPINDPRSAWQGCFTAFGTGTLSYFEMGGEGGRYNKFPEGYRNAAQFYVVEVRQDNSVVLKPYDIISDSFFDVVYFVTEPGAAEKYVYTDERYQTSAKPQWSPNANAVCVESTANEAVFEFPQATCPDVVHSYRIDVEKKELDERTNNETWKNFGSSYFWSEYYFKNQPQTMRTELIDLDEKSSYRAKIVALNPFFKESEQKLTLEFSTPADPTETVDKNAPVPEANMLDIQFKNGVPVNGRETQKTVETFGNPQIVADETWGGKEVARFNGKDDYYKIQFDSHDYGKLHRATLAATFRMDEYPETLGDVFGNTEGRGICFEIDGRNKTLSFWAHVNGQYQIISTPAETGKYIDAFGTFDGKSVILYVNGKEVASKEVSGRLKKTEDPKVKAFCFCADIDEGGRGS
ncbi:MAG: metallophosphoesterase, partial [Thermoguttaceae bacterium]|nr:metallophosphoesterase [Thermoguttaceae bacterium]